MGSTPGSAISEVVKTFRKGKKEKNKLVWGVREEGDRREWDCNGYERRAGKRGVKIR